MCVRCVYVVCVCGMCVFVCVVSMYVVCVYVCVCVCVCVWCVCVCVCVCDLFKQQPSFVKFSQQKLGFNPSAVYVIVKVTGFSAECFGFRLSASFHH